MNNFFKKDKILGYGLLPIVSECLSIKKQDWIAFFKSLNLDFDEELYNEASAQVMLQNISSQMDAISTVGALKTEVVAEAPKEKEKPAPEKVEAQVDFSDFF